MGLISYTSSVLAYARHQRSASGTRVPGIPRPGPGFSGPGLGPGQTFSCGRGTGTEGPVPLGTRDGTRDWKLKKTGPGTGRGTKNWKKRDTGRDAGQAIFYTGTSGPFCPGCPVLQMWLFLTNVIICYKYDNLSLTNKLHPHNCLTPKLSL